MRRLPASLAFSLLVLAGCGGHPTPVTDEEKIVRAALGQLAADGKPVCVDRRTRGLPLAIFRTMRRAPREARVPLAWRPPAPLRPPSEPGARAILRDETKAERLLLPEPGNGGGALLPLEQLRLNGEAAQLSRVRDTDTVTIRSSWGVPHVTARWAPRNWFAGDCAPRYVLSNPVRSRDFGFLSVTAGHWGTTYAFERAGADWRVSAQWSTWLY